MIYSFAFLERRTNMQNSEYLNEEKYQQNNAKVKKVGKILLIVGIVILVLSFILTTVAFLVFGNSAISGVSSFGTGNEINTIRHTASGAFGSIGLFALGGFMGTLGFILTGAGAIVMYIAHRRAITAYTTQQVIPVAQEGIEKITPTVANAAGSIAKSISQGIQEGKQNTNSKE